MNEKFIKNTEEGSEKIIFADRVRSLYKRLSMPVSIDMFNLLKKDEFALNRAILSGDYNMARTLLNNGAELDLNVEKTVSCLNIAISKKDIKMLKILLEHIHTRNIAHETKYDKEVSKLLTLKDMTQKSPLEKAIDLFVELDDKEEKETLKECMKLIYNSPLFDKNNSESYNKTWRDKSTYFVAYEDRLLTSIENYVISTKNDELIKFFVDNGLNYPTKAILCVNPKLYSHAGMIIKYKEPIKFMDSNNEISGCLYSYESKVRLDNVEPTFKSRKNRFLEKLRSFIHPCDALMRRVLLTPKDMAYMENDNEDIYSFANVSNEDVYLTISRVFKTLRRLKRLPFFLKTTLSKLTTDIEDVAYMLSLYTKDANNFVAKDRIINYSFICNIPKIEIKRDTNEGYSIYDLLWNTPKELGLSYNQKISIIEEFLNKECLSVLKENGIINCNDMTFAISDFSKLPSKKPNDLVEKYYYPKTYTFDLELDPKTKQKRDACEIAKCSFKMLNLLEDYNINVTKYNFFKNNCITTLKGVLAKCGYKEQLDRAEEGFKWYQKAYPLAVLSRLKEMDSKVLNMFNKKKMLDNNNDVVKIDIKEFSVSNDKNTPNLKTLNSNSSLSIDIV